MDKLLPWIKSLQHYARAYHTNNPYDFSPAIAIQIARYLEDVASSEPENKPLTVEELRDMDGEPLWIVPLGDADWEPHWTIIREGRVTATSLSRKGKMYFIYMGTYDETWLAYRQKPEEG